LGICSTRGGRNYWKRFFKNLRDAFDGEKASHPQDRPPDILQQTNIYYTRNIYLTIIEDDPWRMGTVRAPETLYPLFENDLGPMNKICALATQYDFDPQFIMTIEDINPGFYHVMSK
jgi:hypothetical protein